MTAEPSVLGREHWAVKGPVGLFLWEKPAASAAEPRGTILFVHGSSMGSQPTFDLQIPGRPDSSAMDHFARLGYDTWCVDMEGYGRSDKHRDVNSDIATGAERWNGSPSATSARDTSSAFAPVALSQRATRPLPARWWSR